MNLAKKLKKMNLAKDKVSDRAPRRIIIRAPQTPPPNPSEEPDTESRPAIDPEISLDGILLRQIKTLDTVVKGLTEKSSKPMQRDEIASLAQCVKCALDFKKSKFFINDKSQEYQMLESIVSRAFLAVDRISRYLDGISDCMDKDHISALNQLVRLTLDLKTKQNEALGSLDDEALEALADGYSE